MMLLIEWREILVRGISRVGYKKLLIFCCYKEIDGKVGIWNILGVNYSLKCFCFFEEVLFIINNNIKCCVWICFVDIKFCICFCWGVCDFFI